MALTVPTLDRRSVLPTTGPVGQVSEQAPDAGLQIAAQGLDRGLRDIAEVQALEQAKADRAELSGLEAKLTSWETNAVFDPQTGAMSKKGSAAFGLGQQYLPEYDKAAQELSSTIASPRVKAAFDALRLSRRGSLEQSLDRYESGQREAYYDSQSDASMAAFRQQVAVNPTDEATVANAKERTAWTINDVADRKGLSTEARQQALLAGESGINRQVITALVNSGSYAKASDYFNANRDQMNEADAAAVDGMVREGMVRSESTRLADELVARHGAGGGALAAAKGIEDPDVRKATESSIRQQISDQRIMINIAEEQASDRAWDIVEKNGGDWKDVPVEVWMTVPGPTREAIRNANERKATSPDGWEKYYELRSLASAPLTAPTFLGMNLMKEAFPYMAPQQAKELMDLQAGLRAGDAKAKSYVDGVQTEDQIVSGALNVMGIRNEKGSTSAAKKASLFRRLVDTQTRDLERQQGRQATTEEVQKIVDDLQIKYTFNREWWTDKQVRSFEITLDDIPPDDRTKIETALKSHGLAVTADSIIDLYRKKLSVSQ